MRDMFKMILMILMLESPLLSIILLKDLLIFQLYKITAGNIFLTRLLFYFSVVVMALVTLIMFLAIHWSAQASVGGKQFLVGHVYKRNQIAEDLQLEFGEHTELADFVVQINGKNQTWYTYVIWKTVENERVADYILLSPVPLREALTASSKWTVVTKGWWAEAEGCYPVTLFELDGKTADIIRERYKLSSEVPIFVLRDYPGRIKFDLVEEPKQVSVETKKLLKKFKLTPEDMKRLGLKGGFLSGETGRKEGKNS